MLKHVVFCAIFSFFIEAMSLSGNNLMIENAEQNGDHEVVRRSSGNNAETRPEVIYITPDNVDSVIQTLRLPSYRELRKRKRPFTIFVEGIVGTGKSTFLEPFQKYPQMDILPEPVAQWQNLNGTDLLDLVYRYPERWATTQESYVQLTMLEEHVRNEAVFKAMERSIHSARHVFNEYFYQTHQTKFVEYALLDSWYQFLNNEDLTGFNLDADMIFYLQTDPEIAYQRAVSRGRPEEATLQKEFLYGIHRLHEDWLIHGNTTTHAKVPSPVVYVLNTSYGYSEMTRIYKKIAMKFWYLLPSELKNSRCWMH